MRSRQTSAVHHANARQRVAMVVALCATLGVARLTGAGGIDGAPGVTVREADGIYWVTARFVVPQARAVALAVLTDYEQIPRFMPDVKTSIVRERSPGRAVVEQEAVSHVIMFSKSVHLVLEISEGADRVRFRDRSGQSFACYEGSWRLSDQDGGTMIMYELTAQPVFSVPGALLKRLLRRDSGRMIAALQREMAARSPR